MINNDKQVSKKRKISEILEAVADDSEVSMIDTSSAPRKQVAKRRKLNSSAKKKLSESMSSSKNTENL